MENGFKVDLDNVWVEVIGLCVIYERNFVDMCCIVGGNGELGFKFLDFRFFIFLGYKICECIDLVSSDGIYNLYESCGNKIEVVLN